MDKRFVIIITALLVLSAFVVVVFFINMKPNEQNQDNLPTPVQTASPTLTPTTEPTATQSAQPTIPFDAQKLYTANLITDKGTIEISLNTKATPLTAKNFVTLARSGFYNGTAFHRIIRGFMIQGGDPKGDGSGGPGYRFDDEPFTGDYTRGTVAMANAGPNTNGSQFFIMHGNTQLPKNYVIFGSVMSGLEVVDAIATAPVTQSPSGEESKPVTPVKVTSVEVVER